MSRRLIIVAVFAWLAGCAHTQITSMRDPMFASRRYHRVLVVLPVNDLAERRQVEDRFASEPDSVFVAGYRILFPGRQYSNDELAATIRESGADAVLLITLNGAGINHSVGTSSTSSAAAGCNYGSCAAASAVATSTYDISKPWASFTAKLFDSRDGRVVWVASSQSRGNAYAKARTLLSSMAETTIERMRTDGVVATGSPPS